MSISVFMLFMLYLAHFNDLLLCDQSMLLLIVIKLFCYLYFVWAKMVLKTLLGYCVVCAILL